MSSAKLSLIYVADTLVRKFEKYLAEMKQRDKLLEKLSQSVTAADLETWERKRQEFEHKRISDPLEADKIFGAKLTQGPSPTLVAPSFFS